MTRPRTLASLLTTLAVPRDGVLYVQSSMDWLWQAGFPVDEVLKTLREWIGEGLLVMPAYPMRSAQREYLRQGPVYDVRRTPAAIGLLPELMRRSASSFRSLDPDFCVVAEGSGAGAVVETDLTETDPFGPRSVYERLLVRGTTFIGLGVSLNTNSFMHVIDSRLQTQYPILVYDPEEYRASVVDSEGVAHQVRRKALLPEFQRLIEPSAVAREFRGPSSAFSAESIGKACFFRWDLRQWSEWCMEHAAARLNEGDVPCWLRRVVAR